MASGLRHCGAGEAAAPQPEVAVLGGGRAGAAPQPEVAVLGGGRAADRRDAAAACSLPVHSVAEPADHSVGIGNNGQCPVGCADIRGSCLTGIPQGGAEGLEMCAERRVASWLGGPDELSVQGGVASLQHLQNHIQNRPLLQQRGLSQRHGPLPPPSSARLNCEGEVVAGPVVGW